MIYFAWNTRLPAILLFGAILTGCSFDSSVTPLEALVGRWQLETINGKRMPATHYDDGFQQLVADSAFFNIDGDETWTQTFYIRIVAFGVGQRQTLRDSGSYERTSNGVLFESSGTGGVVAGKLSGSRLTLDIYEDGDQNRYTFVRR